MQSLSSLTMDATNCTETAGLRRRHGAALLAINPSSVIDGHVAGRRRSLHSACSSWNAARARSRRARAAFRDEHAELEHALAQRAVDANAAKRAHRAALDAAAAEHATEGAAAGRTWEFKTGFNVQWTPAKEE